MQQAVIPPLSRSGAPIPLPGPPDAARLVDPATAKLWKAAQDFEAMALGALLAPVFEAAGTGKGVFGGGTAEETWRPMLGQEISRHIARHGGLGIAVPVYHQLLRMQEAASNRDTEDAP